MPDGSRDRTATLVVLADRADSLNTSSSKNQSKDKKWSESHYPNLGSIQLFLNTESQAPLWQPQLKTNISTELPHIHTSRRFQMNGSQHTSIKQTPLTIKNYIRHLTVKTNQTSIETHNSSHAIKEQALGSLRQPFGELNKTTQGQLLLHSTMNQTSKIAANTPDSLTKS